VLHTPTKESFDEPAKRAEECSRWREPAERLFSDLKPALAGDRSCGKAAAQLPQWRVRKATRLAVTPVECSLQYDAVASYRRLKIKKACSAR
jgi:hypothetical protein